MTRYISSRRQNDGTLTCDCTSDLGRYVAGDPRNLGFAHGRLLTFPTYAVPMTHEQKKYLAEKGFFLKGSVVVGKLLCVGCEFSWSWYGWSPESDVFGEHQRQSPRCPLYAAKKLGYETEVDIVRTVGSKDIAWRKPQSQFRFICDPRDYYIVWPEKDERYVKGAENNIGLLQGRLKTFPMHSIDFSQDAHYLATNGFVWEFNNKPKGLLSCVGCGVKIWNWIVGGAAEEVHRETDPACPWLGPREMETEMYLDERCKPKFVRQ